jgi:uncharacterized protein (DUF4415 family)
MKKKERIVSYTAEELDAMRAGGESKTDWAAVDAKTQAELAADMASDEAWDGVPHDWVSQAVAGTGLMRRPQENKRQVTVRFDADVLEFFRNQGRGWQSRMNAVLRSFVVERQHQLTFGPVVAAGSRRSRTEAARPPMVAKSARRG